MKGKDKEEKGMERKRGKENIKEGIEEKKSSRVDFLYYKELSSSRAAQKRINEKYKTRRKREANWNEEERQKER